MTSLALQMRRLGRHSAVYGLGGIVSRVLAVFLLPLYTRYLTTSDLGEVGLVVALSAVVVTILRAGISSAFFRFYFDSTDAAQRRLVVRTSFWVTMARATFGLVAGVLLWNVAYATGTIDNVERGMESTGWDSFELNGGEIFHNLWIGGLFVAVGLTGGLVLVATLFNLITDLVGGLRFTVLEEEVIERQPSSMRRYASRR